MGERILDFGCGTGDLAAEISKSGADMTGLDISPEMIERAREVRIAMLADRPTRLEGEDGMLKWLNIFGTALIPNSDPEQAENWFSEVAQRLTPTHYRGGYWMLEDYRRLRLVAVKTA